MGLGSYVASRLGRLDGVNQDGRPANMIVAPQAPLRTAASSLRSGGRRNCDCLSEVQKVEAPNDAVAYFHPLIAKLLRAPECMHHPTDR